MRPFNRRDKRITRRAGGPFIPFNAPQRDLDQLTNPDDRSNLAIFTRAFKRFFGRRPEFKGKCPTVETVCIECEGEFTDYAARHLNWTCRCGKVNTRPPKDS